MLLDSNILIDYKKGKREAHDFIDSLNDIAISVVSCFEVIIGLHNRKDLNNFEKFLYKYKIRILHTNSDVSFLSYNLFKKYFFLNHFDFADVIIAATAAYHEEQLATLNIRHFQDIREISLYKPY